MMTVQMDNMSTPSWQMAQRLYNMNKELESRCRKSAQARVPSDPNAWQRMRENYEAIILKDHAFSEKHNIEYALWQLHYRRIDEFRAHFSAASAASCSRTSAGAKPPPRPEQINKARLQFKTFLSEATGFYHDLILKIRAKYGLPLGNFSEDSTSQIVLNKDKKRSVEMKKGLVSCHRCLIYLGDLARYKGLYADGGSRSCDSAAASSYYLQAMSIWPFSGNPHHQLAILATYSGDEVAAVYRYFRSLAVDSPFSTAKDNLVVAFEKNRKIYTQKLSEGSKASATGEGKEKAQTDIQPKDTKVVAIPTTERTAGLHDSYKTFCNYFVRLTGILFTQTSLEQFPCVLSQVGNTLYDLLSSGSGEESSFRKDGVKSGLFIVHFVAILICTVHNVKSNGDGQSHADIPQNKVSLQHALTAAFKLVSFVLKRCTELHDPCKSYLLPGILVFVEWLACTRDVATFTDLESEEAIARSAFWNYCIIFLNKVLSSEPGAIDDEDETCFTSMARYQEEETENRLALWEDFELRGFLPLKPAHAILDFSRNSFVEVDGRKEKVARLRRIISAGKSLVNVIEVDQKVVTFDSMTKMFLLDVKFTRSDDRNETSKDFSPATAARTLHDVIQQPSADGKTVALQPQLYVEGEEEDEEIVFKPPLTEKRNDGTILESMAPNGMDPQENALSCYSLPPSVSVSICQDDPALQTSFDPSPQSSVHDPNHIMQYPEPVQSHYSIWLDQNVSIPDGLKELSIVEDSHPLKPGVEEYIPISQHLSLPVPQFLNVVPSSGVTSGRSGVNKSSESSRKVAINRPVSHLGPPPGFRSVPPKPVLQPISGSDGGNIHLDGYSWLDRYKLPSALKNSGFYQSDDHPFQSGVNVINNNGGSVGIPGFPFRGQQGKTELLPASEHVGWVDKHAHEHLKLYHEQFQKLSNGGQQYIPQLQQYQGHSVLGGRHPV